MYSRSASTPLPFEQPFGAMSISTTFWKASILSPKRRLMSADSALASSRLSVCTLTWWIRPFGASSTPVIT